MQEHSGNYDIIIIGAGLGGLVTAALLAKEGYHICVLEKNKQIGGCLQSFALDKKLFESAVHYIGSLAEGQTLHKIFSYLGLTQNLKLRRLDVDCFDKIILEGKEYDMAQGHENFVDQLAISFPDERKNIQAYVNEIKSICQQFPMYNMRMGNIEGKKAVSGFGLKEKLDSLTTNELLKQVLSGNNLLYGGLYESTPFYIHALIENSYIESSWKCVDGSTQIARLLRNEIEAHGGAVVRNVCIVKMKEENGIIKQVIDDRGNIYSADHFISNLHPQTTFRCLESNLIRPVTRKRIDSLQNTLSSFMVNISLQERSIMYRNYNQYYHTTNEVWKDANMKVGDTPTSFAIFMNEDQENIGFASSISILTYMNAGSTQSWAHSFHTTSNRQEREKSYQDFKLKQIALILDAVSQFIPELKHAVRMADACTPLTYRDYLNTPDGSIYGIRKETLTQQQSILSTRTKIPNLYLTGQNINMHGVLGVSITGVLTAAEFVGLEYLVNKMSGMTSGKS